MTTRKTPQERFVEKVNFAGPMPKNHPELGPCWVWLAGKSADGYGRFYLDGRLVPAHRFMFEAAGGLIPSPDMEMDHFACEFPSCVHPHHVRPVTQRENALRSDTLASLNLAATHCRAGHPYEGSNLAIRPNGDRRCRACDRESWERTGKARRSERQAAAK